jgi:glycosyltransferase involved in cell wall biosynthesis
MPYCADEEAMNYHARRFLLRQFVKRNTRYLKRTSSGNDLVFYCDYSAFPWHPRAKGFAGSEEAVINLTRELAKLGWDVTVYNNCGHKPLVDAGVTYRPWWEFNPRDKQDVVIVWRWLRALDWEINAERIFVELQDTTPERYFTTRNRIAKVRGIFVKSRFHRSFYPNLSDDRIIVVPNGIDLDLLQGDERKDPHLLVNTSSADRSMDVLPKLFQAIKRQVPQARLQWAYGWGLFELMNGNHPEKLRWMRQTQQEMQSAGIESLGNLSQAEVGKLYQRGAVFCHPTAFPETDCISVRKAQASGCVPVATDFAGLKDSIQFGVKIPCVEAEAWKQPGRFHFGIEDEATQRSWVDATVDLLTNSAKRSELAEQGAAWARQFSWPRIAARWDEVLRS